MPATQTVNLLEVLLLATFNKALWNLQTLWCRNTLLSKISEINSELITRNDLALIETLLFGDNSFSQYDNSRILDATIAFIVTSKRLDDPLLV